MPERYDEGDYGVIDLRTGNYIAWCQTIEQAQALLDELHNVPELAIHDTTKEGPMRTT